ncbi:ribonuclease HI [Desulfobotulus sp. H1]|uniref:Ribonuclease H n=1 Tax=Desulfobotulus pelophilus TaxID=2823377 RepID=A0ABT3N9M9_9BACT|nr:ribonuclease HI [Desulfobotulus pelophilus]MCW7754154.1 ribonuclease HI [Desulfobotulus pelophilus]
MASRKKYYAVLRGRKPGVYTEWSGSGGAQEQVMGFPGARYKGFESIEDARLFMNGKAEPLKKSSASGSVRNFHGGGDMTVDFDAWPVRVYSDGGAIGNPGPGGYGTVVIRKDGSREEYSQGFLLTTNNRMELLGAIVGLEAVRDEEVAVLVTSDSRYLVHGIEKGWAKGWRARGWKKSDGSPALNPDLWARLLSLLDGRKVQFQWVKGHSGHEENERCDALAQAAARGDAHIPDQGYKG